MTEANAVTIEKGRAAWARIQQDAHWQDWVITGKALMIGRQDAMREAHTNKPEGGAYTRAFSAWLAAHGFGDMDKGTRARLLYCIDDLDRITAWRAGFATNQRRDYNHPSTVWRKYEASKKTKQTDSKPSR